MVVFLDVFNNLFLIIILCFNCMNNNDKNEGNLMLSYNFKRIKLVFSLFLFLGVSICFFVYVE